MSVGLDREVPFGKEMRWWPWPAPTSTPALPATPDSHRFLFVGGQTAEALHQLDPFGIDWDYDSRIG